MFALNISRPLFPALILIFALAFGITADGKDKRGKNKKRGGKQDQQEKQLIAANQRTLARAREIQAAASRAAQIAGYKTQSAQQEVMSAALAVANLERQVELATTGLRQVEQLIIDDQPEDSKLTLALADVEHAEQQYDAIRRKLLKSPSYQAAYQRALSSSNKAQELPEVRRQHLGNSKDLKVAQAKLDHARIRLEQVRSEVMGSSAEWTGAVEEVRTAKGALVQSEIDLRNGLLGKTSASATYRDAASAAAEAAAIAARCEARIKTLQKKQANSSRPKGKSNSGSRK